MFKDFKNLSKMIEWLQIVVTPTPLCCGIGALIYFPNPSQTNLIIGICIGLIGLIAGIFYANKIWKTKRTVLLVSSISARTKFDNQYLKIQTDFIAILNYRTTEDGGRKTAAHSGYRPAIKFPFDEMLTSGIQLFIGQEKVLPGESVKAEIKIIATEYFKGRLFEELEFDFREGPNIIGTGKILEIRNPILKANRIML